MLKNSKNLRNLLVGVQDITFFKGGMCTIQKGIFDIEIICRYIGKFSRVFILFFSEKTWFCLVPNEKVDRKLSLCPFL